jgi:hypothetical protein
MVIKRINKEAKTKKRPEHKGAAVDEIVRTMQSGAWRQGATSEYAPTTYTSNQITKQVLDPMPQVGSEADHSDAVMGAKVSVKSTEQLGTQKAEWSYNQPSRGEPVDGEFFHNAIE